MRVCRIFQTDFFQLIVSFCKNYIINNMWDLHVNSSLRLSASVSKHVKWLFALSCCFFRKINDFLYNWFCCWFLLNCHVVGSISLATNNWFVYSWFLASFIKERDFLIGFYVVNGWYAITLNACLSPTCYLIGKLARTKKNPAIPNDQAVVQWTSNLTSQRKGMQRPLSATWTQISWILSQWVDLLGAVAHGDVDVALYRFWDTDRWRQAMGLCGGRVPGVHTWPEATGCDWTQRAVNFDCAWLSTELEEKRILCY